jgi:topoisomerase-4 subunit A
MKAMGNRLSAHVVQSVTLIAEHDDDTDVPDPEPDTVEATEITISAEDKVVADAPPVQAPQAEAVAPEDKPAAEAPPKKVDFEITNPDDIDIDDKGQLGLF